MQNGSAARALEPEAHAIDRQGIIGESPAMRKLLETISRVGPRDITVLVRGETGTGKELVASQLHARSRRAAGPCVVFNCAAIAGELADAELFGHARGAFTGAHNARPGFFAMADGGTLVLDEVGELPLVVQPKLLRALQQGEIQQVGSARVERVDVRVIACTNRDLQAEVRLGRFREDLYYRLAVVELVVPPLREHREDIPAMVQQFVHRCGESFGNPSLEISPALIEALQQSDWPGNVRQLENAVARMAALSRSDELGVEALTAERVAETSAVETSARDAANVAPGKRPSLRDQVSAVEKSIIGATLAQVRWNRTRAARRLGLSRTSLVERLKKYGLQPPDDSEI